MDDNKQMVQVFWKEPTATDNSGVDVKVYPSHRNGAVFYEGTQKVEYQFSDNADNRVTCEFYVTVKSKYGEAKMETGKKRRQTRHLGQVKMKYDLIVLKWANLSGSLLCFA
jgi:hypothetical protein